MISFVTWSWALNLLLFSLVTPVLGTAYQVIVGDSASGSAQAETYTPATIVAGVNDTVTYIFRGNHTVTEAGYSDPCGQQSASTFDSGFLNAGQNFTVTVTGSDPVWIRCSHFCTNGMVSAINPPTSGGQSFQQFQANALQSNASTASTTALKSSTAPPSSSTTGTTSSPPATTSGSAAVSRSAISWPFTIAFSSLVLFSAAS